VASAYTFIEGGHVRVDLIYSQLSDRGKKISDIFGTLFFLFPSSILLWWFSWPLATNSMFQQRPINIWSTKASWRGFKWEASGTAEFSWVWTFKFLILVFAGLMFIQAFTFLLRNLFALRVDPKIVSHPKIDTEPDNSSQPGNKDDLHIDHSPI
jgi:TRAP-type mannitol/chloroaromatic compound transport system permease small subunit